MTTLKPIATAIAELKAQGGENSPSDQNTPTDSNTPSDPNTPSNQNTPSNPNTPSNSENSEGFALTITTSGSGSASVTKDGNAVTSGASLNEDDEVAISITPAEGQVPTATLNGSSIELTESEGVYTGNFAMPGQASTLVINTGAADDDGFDKD